MHYLGTVPTTMPFIVQTKTNNKSFNEFIANFCIALHFSVVWNTLRCTDAKSATF